MRNRARLGQADRNQPLIVKALEKIGARVVSLTSIGGGVPDLLVSHRGRNFLIECKTERGKLNDKQAEFHANWLGAPQPPLWTDPRALDQVSGIVWPPTRNQP